MSVRCGVVASRSWFQNRRMWSTGRAVSEHPGSLVIADRAHARGCETRRTELVAKRVRLTMKAADESSDRGCFDGKRGAGRRTVRRAKERWQMRAHAGLSRWDGNV